MTVPQTSDASGLRTSQIVLIEDAKGIGTGIEVSSDGWILTNKHVAASLGPFRVLLANGQDVRGVGVHQSPHHDLAIVKIGLERSSFLDLERDVREDCTVGTEVFALGHPRGCRFSVSKGIISNPHREFDKEHYIQSDVAINPGNSGGPLVDREGRLVGVVTMMLTFSQGLGFAVPAHTAADYVRHVRRLIRNNVVRIPMELLLQPMDERSAPDRIVRSAVDAVVLAGRASIESDDHQGEYELRRQRARIRITAKDGTLFVRAFVAALGPHERKNPTFLLKLLELNATRDLGSACFAIDDEGLHIGVRRSWSDLDLAEAVGIIDNVIALAEQAPGKVAAISIGASPAAAAPLPPLPTPDPADPGYPIISLPTSTDWK